MRLLITTDTVGGVWRFGLELTAGLLEAGDNIALVSFGRTPSAAQVHECEQLAQYWQGQFSYTAAEIPLEWMQNNDRCWKDGAAILSKIEKNFGAEILHCNQYCYCAADLAIPSIVTAHSDVLSWAQACRGGPLEDSPWLRRYCALVQCGLDAADAVTAPTKWMLRAVEEHFRLPASKQVIANGCTVVADQQNAPRMLRAVIAGRLWDEGKDILLLRDTQSPIPLVIAGACDWDGVKAHSMTGVQYYGELSQKAILNLFSESAIYVCTSRYEPFGLAPLEAALCGCAMVARNIESLREVWGDAALYFTDAAELSNLLQHLASDPIRLRIRQNHARERAQRYSRKKMVHAYRELYSNVMAREYACAR
ncbi:MAG TPA: glycosyltransferase family 4 protein [Edaphobacter sp.]|nr:glycosyltransferase family 4 protein [Edaphobacter sp.]